MNKRKLALVIVPALLAIAALAVILLSQHRGPKGPAVICLDPGHGGSASGAEFEGRLEKDDNLKLGLRVRELLEASGCKLTVVMTREDDSAVELQKRCDIAEDENATMFVSLHRNSGGGKGIETWTAAKPERYDRTLAAAIQEKLVAVEASADRGVRAGTAANPKSNYQVLGQTDQIPSCLVELGFIDSTEDNELLDKHFEEYAAAIAEGILEAAGLK